MVDQIPLDPFNEFTTFVGDLDQNLSTILIITISGNQTRHYQTVNQPRCRRRCMLHQIRKTGHGNPIGIVEEAQQRVLWNGNIPLTDLRGKIDEK